MKTWIDYVIIPDMGMVESRRGGISSRRRGTIRAKDENGLTVPHLLCKTGPGCHGIAGTGHREMIVGAASWQGVARGKKRI
jgi:hypothetical protein